MAYRGDPPELATPRRGAHLPILDRLTVSVACRARWDTMVGDDRVRHCRACDQHVYDTRAMTTTEVEGLVTQVRTGTPVCARLYRRPDGTLITRDCTESRLARVRAMRRRWVASVVAASAIVVGWWSVPDLTSMSGAVWSRSDLERRLVERQDERRAERREALESAAVMGDVGLADE